MELLLPDNTICKMDCDLIWDYLLHIPRPALISQVQVVRDFLDFKKLLVLMGRVSDPFFRSEFDL